MDFIFEKIERIYESSYKYSSVQLNLPSDFKSTFNKVTSMISDDDLFYSDINMINGREDTPHVTVRYGLHTTDPKDVAEIIEGFGPISFTLGKIDMFSNDDKPFDVVIVEVVSPKLMELNKLVSDNLEFTCDYDTYTPHLTLAYVETGEAEKYKGKTPLKGESFNIDTVMFSGSDGNKKDIVL